MKKIALFLVLVSLLIIVACSDENITGGSTAPVATLTVNAESENGTIITGASIYVNGEFKGKTNAYGEEKGSRMIVVEGINNLVRVEKEGYTAAEPRIVSSASGNQQVTFVMESQKTKVLVAVSDSDGTVPEAKVSLRKGNSPIMLGVVSTDDDGVAIFTGVEDGDYSIQVRKEGYIPAVQDASIDHHRNNGAESITIIVTHLPELLVLVVDQQGDPLDTAEVSLYTREGYNSPGTSAITASYTGSSGEVLFQNVDYDMEYVLVTRRDQYLTEVREVSLTPDSREATIAMTWDIG